MPSLTTNKRADGADDAVLTPGTESADFVSAALNKDDQTTRLARQRLFQSGDYSDIKLVATLRRIYTCLSQLDSKDHPQKEALVNGIAQKLKTLQQEKAKLALLDAALYHEARARHLADLEQGTTKEGLMSWMQTATHEAKTSASADNSAETQQPETKNNSGLGWLKNATGAIKQAFKLGSNNNSEQTETVSTTSSPKISR